MKILVVDDKHIHRAAAKLQLAKHEVTAVKSFVIASELLNGHEGVAERYQNLSTELQRELGTGVYPQSKLDPVFVGSSKYTTPAKAIASFQKLPPVPFDAVLLDLNMPAEKTASCMAGGEGEVPYGFILALRAVQCGVKYVGIITDANHHSGPLTAALDLICPAYWHTDEDQPIFRIGETRLVIAHAPFEEGDGVVKDWGRLLSRLAAS